MKNIVIAAALIAGLAVAQDAAKKPEAKPGHDHAMAGHKVSSAKNLQWGPGPAALPPGAQAAILEGDPRQPGEFTLRLKFPAGYKIPPHSHPAVEHVTVLSGEANFGMGDKWDESKGTKLSAGDFIYMQPGQKHFAWTKVETVIQLHGQGPWQVNYVNPSDDPRNKK